MVSEGPYYVTGEYIRSNVTETQQGVAVHLEYQYIDISTCGAATGLYLDTWEANATGVYSGVLGGNGNEADTANLVCNLLSTPTSRLVIVCNRTGQTCVVCSPSTTTALQLLIQSFLGKITSFSSRKRHTLVTFSASGTNSP